MSFANCNLSTLQTAAKCFDCLSATEKQALKVRFMAELYKKVTGIDLTNINVLKRTVACFGCEPDFTLESMQVAIAKNAAEVAGVTTIPATIQGMRALISCVPCGEQKWARAAEVYLMCQISRRTIS
jgi:hypothetical protein